MKRTNYFFLAVSLIAILGFTGSCKKIATDSSSLYSPTAANVTAKATLTELQQGRTLFINNCGNCHGLYSPDAFSVAQWKSVLGIMAPRTAMNTSQVLLVTKYVCRGNQ
jgi:hypothetical protein